MTDEELKKAMNKIIIVICILLIFMILVGIFIFNNYGKSTTIFKNEEQKERYNNTINEGNNDDISVNDIAEIESNQGEIVNEIQSENKNTTLE